MPRPYTDQETVASPTQSGYRFINSSSNIRFRSQTPTSLNLPNTVTLNFCSLVKIIIPKISVLKNHSLRVLLNSHENLL